VPRELETVCLRAMSRKPNRRYPTAAALAEDLRRFLAGWPVKARRAGPTVRAARWLRRKLLLPALVLALQVVIILAVIKVTLAMVQADAERPVKETPNAKADAPSQSKPVEKPKANTPAKTILLPGMTKKK
jgi:hypothetical protein